MGTAAAAVATVAVAATAPAVVTATTVAALPVASPAQAVSPAAAHAAAQVKMSVTGPTNSPATPLWAQAMGANLPVPVPLPPAGYPPATVYVVNYLSKDLFFKQAN